MTEQAVAAAPRPPGTWRIGRIAGADLLIRPSLLIMAGLLFYVFADGLEGGDLNPWLAAGALVVAVYASIVVHELAHLAVARSHGQTVTSITLHLLGGETAIDGEARTPWQEFWTAAVGPIASAVLGFVVLAASVLVDGTTGAVLEYLGKLNIVLALFNMLPAWPMDGGRVLRAFIWAVTGRESTGLRVAGWVSRFAAIALLAAGVWWFFDQGSSAQFALLISILLAWFLWVGAGTALHHGRRMSRVEHLAAATFAEPGDAAGLPRIPFEAKGEQLLRAMASRPSDAYALVDEEGREQGVLMTSAVEAAYRRNRQDV